MQEQAGAPSPEGAPAAKLADLFGAQRQRLLRLISFRMSPLLRGRVDAEDILQEAYLAAAKRCHHYENDPSVSLFVWLRSIVLQTLTDLHRHHLGVQKRDPRREVSLQAQPPYTQATSASIVLQLEGDLTSPSQAAARADAHALVTRAVEQMDDTDREVLALRHFEELTNKEVAEVLGIEQKAASIRYVRALKRLKALLTDVSEFRERMGHG